MFCSIYKWKISRAMDSGKPLSQGLKQHLERCGSCREFARAGKELERRLAEDAADLIQCADASLGERVRASLGGHGEAESPSPVRPQRLSLKPVMAMAASLAVVAVGVIWLTTSRSAKMPSLDSLFKSGAPGTYLESAIEKAESPYQKEILVWKQLFKSKADALKACLDLGLGD